MAGDSGQKGFDGGTVTGISVFVVALVSAGVLGGCATFSRDRGFGTVEQAARERLHKDVKWPRDDGERASIRSAVKELLASPLSADNAVQLALLNNPGLQATYAELGIAEADLVQAGRMTNPHFAYLRTSEGGARKLEWALTFPIIDLLTMPLRTRIEGRRFEQVKLAVAGRMLEVATVTRKSWIETVAAEASFDLASRMERAGNFNRLDRMREQVFHAETEARLARTRQAAVAGRERLTRLMGLSGDDAAAAGSPERPALPAGGHAEWLDPALAHEGRMEGVPPHR